MQPKVYITRRIPQPAIDYLQTFAAVEVNPYDRNLAREELLAAVAGRDAVLCMLNDTIDAEVLQAAEGVKIFANYAVGFNNIDLQTATQRGVMITNTPGVLTAATADLAWALLFAVARRVVEADQYTRQGKFAGWAPLLFLGQDITGKTLGVLGLGRIGKAMAKRATGFEMRIIYHSNRRDEEFERETGARFVDLPTLFTDSDYLSLHVPLTPSTRHLVGEKELRMMKKSAILINTARGPVVDEQALVQALREGIIAGAGLDVYEEEPVLAQGLAELPNVVVLPHVGSATTETRTRMGMMAAENIKIALDGKRPPNLVNTDVWR